MKTNRSARSESDARAVNLDHLALESPEVSRPLLLRYGCAVATIALATWVRILFDPMVGDRVPFPTLLFAVLLTAWYGGVGPALAAVMLGGLSADCFLLPARVGSGFNGAARFVELSFYLTAGIGIAVHAGVLQAAFRKAIRKLHQAREALADTEERLRLTLRCSGVAVWSWDIARDVVEADDNCCVLFGLPLGKFPIPVEGSMALVHREDIARVRKEVAASVEDGVEFNTEFRVVRPDGALRYLAARGQVIPGDHGRPQRLTGVFWDLTGRVAAESKFRALLEAAPDAMVVTNREGKIVLVNGQVEKLFGYARAELLGQSVEILTPKRFRDKHSQQRANYHTSPQMRAMGAGPELFALRKDGTQIAVEISLSPWETEEGSLVCSAIRDITERKRVERSREQLATLVDCSDDAIIGKTLEGIIVNWNKGAERLYGYTGEEVIGKPVTMLLPPGRDGQAVFAAVRRTSDRRPSATAVLRILLHAVHRYLPGSQRTAIHGS